jgi:hypothetical protein
VILLFKERHDCFGRNWRLVARDLGEEVVRHVVRRDMVKEMSANDAEIPINCYGSAADIIEKGSRSFTYAQALSSGNPSERKQIKKSLQHMDQCKS